MIYKNNQFNGGDSMNLQRGKATYMVSDEEEGWGSVGPLLQPAR